MIIVNDTFLGQLVGFTVDLQPYFLNFRSSSLLLEILWSYTSQKTLWCLFTILKPWLKVVFFGWLVFFDFFYLVRSYSLIMFDVDFLLKWPYFFTQPRITYFLFKYESLKKHIMLYISYRACFVLFIQRTNCRIHKNLLTPMSGAIRINCFGTIYDNMPIYKFYFQIWKKIKLMYNQWQSRLMLKNVELQKVSFTNMFHFR